MRGSPIPHRSALAIGGLVLVAGLAMLGSPPAQAKATDSTATGVLESTFDVEVLVPTGSMEVLYNPGPGDQVPAAGINIPNGNCGTDHFQFNQSGDWFRFSEAQSQNGCGEARYGIDIPAGVTSVSVHFAADRAILQPSTFPVPIDIVQDLNVYGPDGTLAAAFPYYEPTAPQHLQAQAFDYSVDLEPGQPNVTVGWSFSDNGQAFAQALVNPVAGQSFSSTVSDPRIVLGGLPFQPEAVTRQRLGLQDDTVRYATTVSARIPDSLGVSGRIGVNLRVADDLQFTRVVGPRGEPVEDELVRRSDVGEVHVVQLTGEATARHGPGVYGLVFASSTPIRPSPLLYPFIAAVLAVPAGAGALALRSTRQFRRQATPEFASTAATLDHVVLVMLGVYLILPIGVLVTGRLPLLASWPLEGEAGLVYLLIGLAFVAFLAIGFVGRRHLGNLMQEEQGIQERSRRELERSNRELAEFAYVASHDLQEPLRTVASYTQLLQRRYKGKLDADADEFIDSAVEGAQRMQLLIQDLLAYSRVGSKPEDPTSVDLGAVVEDVRRMLRQAIQDAQAEVVVAKALPTVVGHERQFAQLLQNLIANAVKFRSPDRAPRVQVAAEPVPGGWRVTVKDNGIGIDPKHFDRIFQIFQRLHARDEYPGTGIGLAICKRIVELNGGRIGVESVLGQGSTFWFTVPDRPLPPPAGPSSAPAERPGPAAAGGSAPGSPS